MYSVYLQIFLQLPHASVKKPTYSLIIDLQDNLGSYSPRSQPADKRPVTRGTDLFDGDAM